MRTSICGLMLPAVLMLGACGAPALGTADVLSAPAKTVPLGNDFILAPGSSATTNGGALTVGFTGVVQESRCPTNALIQCVWEGSARAALTVREQGPTQSLVLETLVGKDTVSVGPYLIRLVDVSPFPVTTDPIPAASYRITLRVVQKP